MTVEEYLKSLVNVGNTKYQFVNINLDDVDDDFAKVITKIYSRLIFDYSKGLTERASNPFHLVIEEAHRYIQNDNDRFLIGYNIFERIAKEGRKYGVILGIITQRPVELSDTVISQCSNFLIFKMNHPVDVEYIRKMVPNISDEIVEKQKTLQSGTCLGFGAAFRIPMIVKMEMPNPAPWSGNCDVVSFWGGGSALGMMAAPTSGNSIPSVSSPGLFSPSNIGGTNDIKKVDTPSSSLVAIKEEKVEEPSMHAGTFGLVEEEEVPVEDIKVPTTDTGVNLVNLSGPTEKKEEQKNITDASSIVVPAAPVGLENNFEEKIATVDLSAAAVNKPLADSNTPMPSLVSFNPSSVQMNEEPKVEEKPASPVDHLVSFNNLNDNPAPAVNNNLVTMPTTSAGGMVSLSNGLNFGPNDMNQPMQNVVPPVNMGVMSTPNVNTTSNVNVAPTANAAPAMSVMAAPTVNTNIFENTGTGDFVDNSGFGFVNSEPSGLVNLNAVPSSPQSVGLVNFGIPGGNEGASDSFGKTENDTQSSNGSFNPLDAINNIENRTQGNDGFAAPTGMSFGGDGGNVNQAPATPSSSLVSFLDQMS